MSINQRAFSGQLYSSPRQVEVFTQSMKTEIIREESHFLSLAGVWNQLLQKSSADTVFLTFEWLSTWWHYFGSGKQLFIVLVKDGDRIIGAAPLMFTSKEGFRQLSFIGGTTTEAKDFIASDDSERQQIIEAILDAIQGEPGWDFFRWDGFREDSPNFIPLKTILFRHKELRPMLLDDDVSPYISVDEPWEGYWSGLKRGVRNDIQRLLRILEREKGSVTYHSPKDTNEAACLMDQLIKFQLTRAREVTHRPSVLEDAVTVEFYKSLASQLLTRGWLSLPVLSVEGEIAALHFGFEYAGKYFYYMPTFNRSFEKYGVGKGLLLYLIRNAFGQGLTEFDLLLGNEPYKFSFNPKVRKLYSIVFFQRSFRGHASEMWFGRLRPRLENLVKKSPLFERLNGRLVSAKYKKHEASNGGGASKQAGVPRQEEPSSKGTMKEVVLTTHEASVTTKNISTVTLLKVGQYPFLIASMMLIPRLMGPATYGEYALLISIITMTASLIDFGGGTDMFGRFVPEFEVLRRIDQSSQAGLQYPRHEGSY